MFLGLLDPDPLVWDTDMYPDPSSNKQNTKNLNPIVLWLLYDFLSLKNVVIEASKSNKQKSLEKNNFYLPSWRSLTKIADPDPESDPESDPLVRGTDRQHWC